MTSHTPSRAGSWTRGRLAQAGVGLGVAASVLASAAVATAATTPSAAHAAATAQPSVVHVTAHAQANPYSSVTVSPGTARAGLFRTTATKPATVSLSSAAGPTCALMLSD